MNPQEKEQDFARLVKQYQDMLWHIASDYSLSAAYQRDDCFQEILIMLWHCHGSLRQPESERQWVYRIATNTMLMLQRKKSNLPTQPLPSDEEPAASVSEYFRQEDYDHLRQLIEQLDYPDNRIVRCHLDGFKFAEIAASMQMSTVAVFKRYYRAIKKIMLQYEDII